MADDTLAFPWAAKLAADELGAFIEDLWGAASGENSLATLEAIEKVIDTHRPAAEAPPVCPLGDVHLEVLVAAASGETPLATAQRLGVRKSTIYTRRNRACTRLNAESLEQALAVSVLYGWIARDAVEMPQFVPRRGATTWTRLYRQRAAECRERPGQWLSTGPYTSSESAKRAAKRLRNGLIHEFKPAGSFQAEPHREDGQRVWSLRIRYVGIPNQAERTAS